MKELAKGKNERVVLNVCKMLLNSVQGSYHETFLEDEGIQDIAEVMVRDQKLFSDNDY